jgi:hypothetical protein
MAAQCAAMAFLCVYSYGFGLPFLFAQLSRYHSNGYPMLRESQAQADGNTLLLRSEKVPVPVAVCYAWEGLAPALPLWNGAGLPASPFRAALNGRAEPICPTVAAATK